MSVPKVKNYFKRMTVEQMARHRTGDWNTILKRRDFIWFIARMLGRAPENSHIEEI